MEQQYIQETTWLEMQVKIVFLSLDKDGDVVIGGTAVPKSRPYIPLTVAGENTKSFKVQRKDLKFVSIDVKLQQDSKGKQTQQKEDSGKLLLLLEYG